MYNFKKISGSKFLSYKDWGVGNYVIGQVTAIQESKLNAKNSDLVVDILEATIKIGDTPLKKGESFTINGSAALQKAVDRGIEVDDIVKVVYTGTTPTKTGAYKGKPQNTFDIFVAPVQDKAKFEANSEEDEDLI